MKTAKWIDVSKASYCGCRITVAFVLTAFLAGCGGGGGGGGGGVSPGGVSKVDLHGDSAGFATTIDPDGAKIHGAINTSGDVDFFKYRGVAGVVYTFQLIGHPAPAPDFVESEFTNLHATILRPDGGTQLGNSTGTDGGTLYDIDPMKAEVVGDFYISGDSRILWTCPTTSVYYLRLENTRLSVGNYVISVASSQEGFQLPEPNNFMASFVRIEDDNGIVRFDRAILSRVSDAGLNANDLFSARVLDFSLTVPEVRLLDDNGVPSNTPEIPAFHLHYGVPHAFFPLMALNFAPFPVTNDGGPHPFAFELPLEGLKDISSKSPDEPGVFESPLLRSNGEETGVIGTVTKKGVTEKVNGMRMIDLDIRLDFGASKAATSAASELPDDVWRSIIGFPWYADVHFTNVLTLFPECAATSRAYGGTYDIFETNLEMSPLNVVPAPPFPKLPFTLRFDSALQTFQLPYQIYDVTAQDFQGGPSFPEPIKPTFADQYAGGVIDIHRGAPGTNGPVIIDLGHVPQSRPPQAYHSTFSHSFTNALGEREVTIPAPPGQRHVVKKLSDSEMDLLRREYYFGGGVYVDVHTADNPNGAVRADIFLETALDGRPIFTKSRAESQGTVSFVSSYEDGGDITVVANGAIRGTIDRASSGELECGGGETGEAVSLALVPGTYYYRATAEDGTEWDGLITLDEGSCETITLSVE